MCLVPIRRDAGAPGGSATTSSAVQSPCARALEDGCPIEAPPEELPPLPHGAEVTTCSEKQLHVRRVARGLIGRVVRARGGGYDVVLTGMGVLWYAAAELAPRRGGRLEFAQRREEAWGALWPCRVLGATVLHRVGLELARRAVERRPGPWGLEAPAAPMAENPADLTATPSEEAS